MKLLQHIATLFLISSNALVMAQESISLSDQDISRLGIVFSQLQPSNDQAGVTVPARIISAPAADNKVRAFFSGVVTKWHAGSGDELTKGDLVVTIRSQEVLVMQQVWLDSVVALEEQQFQLQKDEALFEKGVISRQRLEQTRRALAKSENSWWSARETLMQAGISDNDLQALRTGQGLGFYNIRAGQEGILSHIAVKVGEFVAADSIIGSIIGSNLWLQARVPGRLAGRLDQGQQLSVATVDIPLTLMQKDLEIDPESQTVDILARFEGRIRLVPGQLVNLVIPSLQGGVIIPAEAVVRFENEQVIYVKTASGIESRPLVLSPLGADYLATSGVTINESVVVRGAAIIKGIQLGLGGE